jgi:hypothetical protein
MFRAGIITVTSMFLIAATAIPSPIPKPTNVGKPQVSEHYASAPKQDSHDGQNVAKPPPGMSSDAPLYVNANCKHGCGYTEETKGFWVRLWTDPIAAFAALLFVANILLWIATLRASRAAQAAADALPNVEAAQLFVEIREFNLRAILDRHLFDKDDLGKGWAGDARVQFVVINHGKTPAIVKEIRAAVDCVSAGGLIINVPSTARLIPTNGQEVIAPNKFIPVGELDGAYQARPIVHVPDRGCPREDFKHSLYKFQFFGHIIYEDVFGGTRVAEFSYVFRGGKDNRLERWPPIANRRYVSQLQRQWFAWLRRKPEDED